MKRRWRGLGIVNLVESTLISMETLVQELLLSPWSIIDSKPCPMSAVLTVVLSGAIANVLPKAIPFTQYVPCGKSIHSSNMGDISRQAL